jgi:uncharacterized hydrophobic protein (TIGR00341 family)
VRQLEITVPEDNSGDVKEVLEDYSSDIISIEGERNDEEVAIFQVTVDSDDLDAITDELKSLKEIENGQLVIRVLEEQALIQKGQQTKGSSTMLSQEEIYSKAQEAAGFSQPQWALIGLSSAIAAYGLMLDNIAVVIGAMMLAPILSPIVSAAISLKVGDSTLLKKSFITGVLAVFSAVIISAVSVAPFTPEITETMRMIVSAGVPNMMLSLFVGSAAVLAFVTGLRDQIAGVAVAIALVPPLAATGVGLRIGDLVFALEAVSIASVNLLAVLVSGTVSLEALGVEPSTYYRKKSAERMKYIFPVSVLLMLAVMTFLLTNRF